MQQPANSHQRKVDFLDWPREQVGENCRYLHWVHPGSNICLDFHGDPGNAQLAVFSDGNHHMALRECLDLFLRQNKGLSGLFYATALPGPIINMLRTGGLQLGNLIVRVSPHVFISPPQVLDTLITVHIVDYCVRSKERSPMTQTRMLAQLS